MVNKQHTTNRKEDQQRYKPYGEANNVKARLVQRIWWRDNERKEWATSSTISKRGATKVLSFWLNEPSQIFWPVPDPLFKRHETWYIPPVTTAAVAAERTMVDDDDFGAQLRFVHDLISSSTGWWLLFIVVQLHVRRVLLASRDSTPHMCKQSFQYCSECTG